MSYVVEVLDCRGYRIICTEEIWYGKILVSRPWMKGWESLVSQAVQTPSFICQDADHKDRHAYYMLHLTPNDRYIKVVARINVKNEGFIISAFPTDSGKKKESVIWMPSKD